MPFYYRTISSALADFRGVGSINLHANNITRLAEIDKLASLKGLKYLTLHGNPVETGAKSKLHYRRVMILQMTFARLKAPWCAAIFSFVCVLYFARNYIITKFPNLKKLDFTPITKQDRDTAKVWAKQRQAIRQRRRR